MEELKPCPFCGNDLVIWDCEPFYFISTPRLYCQQCGIEVKFRHSNDAYDLAEAWNRRVDNG